MLDIRQVQMSDTRYKQFECNKVSLKTILECVAQISSIQLRYDVIP